MRTIVILILVITVNGLFFKRVLAQDIGNAAPDFSIETLSNGTYKLADQQGKVVVIFFLGNECPFCISVAPELQSDIYEKYSARTDFSMIGIDTWSQSTAKLPGFKSKTNVVFPLGVNGSSIANSYNIGYDKLAVIDKDGILVHKTASGRASGDINNAVEKINKALAKMATSIEDKVQEESVRLGQNYPNPVNKTTTIEYNIKKSGFVNLSVYDITGKIVKTLVSEEKRSGDYKVVFDATNLQGGLYYYQLKAANIVDTKRMLVR